jgi:hypothetical protein
VKLLLPEDVLDDPEFYRLLCVTVERALCDGMNRRRKRPNRSLYARCAAFRMLHELANPDAPKDWYEDDRFFGVLCDVIERAWQGLPVCSYKNESFYHTSSYARAEALKIVAAIEERLGDR